VQVRFKEECCVFYVEVEREEDKIFRKPGKSSRKFIKPDSATAFLTFRLFSASKA
jgi:hypothetical protein